MKDKGKDLQTEKTIAARCLQDHTFARQILAGDDHPAVRSAIIADLEEARGSAGMLNPQPIPPGDQGFELSLWVQQERIWAQWAQLDRTNLGKLASR